MLYSAIQTVLKDTLLDPGNWKSESYDILPVHRALRYRVVSSFIQIDQEMGMAVMQT